MFKKPQKVTRKLVKKGVYQCLGVTLKCWLTPISWLTPEENVVPLVTENVVLASESLFQPANLFAGQKTQQ